jgi:putative Ca2+/H+ antiporter (TMEM165/GDT1 family)
MLELTFWSAVWETYMLMSIAEIFDKTFFVILVLAIRYNKFAVWTGGSLALLAHTFLAAFGGALINAGLNKAYIDLSAAGLYFIFAGVYVYELQGLPEDQDVAERSQEVADLETYFERPEGAAEGTEPTGAAPGPAPPGGKEQPDEATPLVAAPAGPSWCMVFWVGFVTTFIAEIGDRTQVALISQHAAQPLWAVVLGASVAFLQLNGVAVLVGDLVQRQGLKERTVVIVAAAAFVVFGLITLQDAIFELRHPEMGKVRP